MYPPSGGSHRERLVGSQKSDSASRQSAAHKKVSSVPDGGFCPTQTACAVPLRQIRKDARLRRSNLLPPPRGLHPQRRLGVSSEWREMKRRYRSQAEPHRNQSAKRGGLSIHARLRI